MKKILITILLFVIAFSACRKNGSSSSGLDILKTDEKDAAAEIVKSANADLQEVKKIYKANQKKADEIKEAMDNKEVDKVKAIANDLVIQINSGIEKAKEAVEKIQKAEDMEINETYKDYLGYKRQALEKQIEAFELRRQIAQLVRDGFGGKDDAKIDQAKALFKDKELQFDKLMAEGEEASEKANDIYKESLKKK